MLTVKKRLLMHVHRISLDVLRRLSGGGVMPMIMHLIRLMIVMLSLVLRIRTWLMLMMH